MINLAQDLLRSILRLTVKVALISNSLSCYTEKNKLIEDKAAPSTPLAMASQANESQHDGAANSRSSAAVQYSLVPITDENGASAKLQDYDGKPLIVFFGYASCGSVCPTSLAYLAQELDLLGDERKRIVPIFISIDSQSDTSEKVRLFVKQFASDIKGFTGTAESIRQLVTAFKPLGNYVSPTQRSSSHSLSHFRSFLLVDPKGQISGMFAPPYERGALASFISKHLLWYQSEHSFR
jgi:cytochrome oxidase Cu insertion factor (SCO1/SenC/PrrC family)